MGMSMKSKELENRKEELRRRFGVYEVNFTRIECKRPPHKLEDQFKFMNMAFKVSARRTDPNGVPIKGTSVTYTVYYGGAYTKPSAIGALGCLVSDWRTWVITCDQSMENYENEYGQSCSPALAKAFHKAVDRAEKLFPVEMLEDFNSVMKELIPEKYLEYRAEDVLRHLIRASFLEKFPIPIDGGPAW